MIIKGRCVIPLLFSLLFISTPLYAQQSSKKKSSVHKIAVPAKAKVVKHTASQTSAVSNKKESEKANKKNSTVKKTASAKNRNPSSKTTVFKSGRRFGPKRTSVREKKATSPFEQQKGKLSVPVSNARIIRPFGKCPHPTLAGVYVDNLGVDLRTKSPAPVRSVFPGIITEVFSLPGIGGTVIVKHGDYYTVYSGIDVCPAEKNKKINKGQVLGSTYKTSSGTSDFSFQIWHGRQKLDPKDWILPPN